MRSGQWLAVPALAPVAHATADIDLADNPLPDPVAVTRRCRFHRADELVPRHPGEAGIALEQLQVGAADTGPSDRDPAFAGCDLDVTARDFHHSRADRIRLRCLDDQ